jgi:hypothetical protein
MSLPGSPQSWQGNLSDELHVLVMYGVMKFKEAQLLLHIPPVLT